ncbi:hypothetical protein KIMH_06050 [Bombiscardovia apis]|uniref:Protein CR006 P-loop domain-containing protein n=1 Tax=Bombiscardovia apis TaxID=2932182 RepID=A0ABN6SEQ6_9BIFI|nr:AAA family ATPase [Bombiscardovia apis]BDR54494.1 hypothetical protein KIMH_06050 [Bombiscardovia apis]
MNINKIQISAPFCFGNNPLMLDNLGKVNFVFAPNGSGKTTISNALAEQPKETEKRRRWGTAPTTLAIRVFNEAYKQQVMQERINGIFTLGKESQKVNEEIDGLTNTINEEKINREKLLKDIGEDAYGDSESSSFVGQLKELKNYATDTVFEQHKVIPQSVVSVIFKGFRNSKNRFFEEVSRRYKECNKKEFCVDGITWDLLNDKLRRLSADGKRCELSNISIKQVLSADDREIIETNYEITSKEGFAALIEQLNNADWVYAGRLYVEQTNGVCPFCQQEANDLSEELSRFFADNFASLSEKISETKDRVNNTMGSLRIQLTHLSESIKRDLEIDSEQFEKLIRDTNQILDQLSADLQEKLNHPTKAIEIKDVSELILNINDLIDDANIDIKRHNLLVDNAASAKSQIVDDGWSLFLSDSTVNVTMKQYEVNREQLEQRIEEARETIRQSESKEKEWLGKREKLQSSISNTTEVADRINNLLKVSGFDRFHLAEDHQAAGGYKIVRDNNDIAISTLSEGEKSFICFAYYWESLKGSFNPNETPEDVAAVIDDPISSLDSDVLFMVSSYIRSAALEAISGKGNIKQLIVLTHNVQFHKEAAYCSGTPKVEKRHYYRLYKSVDGYTVCKDDENVSQIRNTYQMLWESVVAAALAEDESEPLRIGVTNIVRRIVEGYFSFLGEEEKIVSHEEMSISEQRIIEMFGIWSNAGSHTIADDISQTIDIGSIKRFLALFQLYFTDRGQANHFNAMINASGGNQLLEKGGLFSGDGLLTFSK